MAGWVRLRHVQILRATVGTILCRLHDNRQKVEPSALQYYQKKKLVFTRIGGWKGRFSGNTYLTRIVCHGSLTTATHDSIEPYPVVGRILSHGPEASDGRFPFPEPGIFVMDRPEKLPQVAFVINLSSTDSTPSTSLVHHLEQLFLGNQIPVTWSVDSSEQAKMFFKRQISTHGLDVALSLPANEPHSSRKLHSLLRAQLRELEGMTGCEPSLVLGNCNELRSRAAVLAQEGIGAVLSTESLKNASFAKSIPCGLWQLNPGLSLPQPNRFWSLFTGRKPSLRNLVTQNMNSGTMIVLVSVTDLTFKPQQLGTLLQDASNAAKRGQIGLAKMHELIANLVDQRRIKPQRSILRAAA